LVPAPDGGDDFVWIGGPGEGLRLLIVLFEEAVDCGLQVGDGPKDAALEPALCEGREEALDGVKPGSRCRRLEAMLTRAEIEDAKPIIRAQLSALGIRRSNLFPDLASLATELKSSSFG
jgi:hypothetical protein